MIYFYEAASSGFYLKNGPGRVAVTESEHSALMAAQGLGKIIVARDDGAPVAVDPPSLTTEQAWSCLRLRRDQLLTASDWRVAPDSPTPASAMTEWRAYRQALRDLPSGTVDPLTPIWPAPPS